MKKLTKIVVVIMIMVCALSMLACSGTEGKVTLIVVGDDTNTYELNTTGKNLSTLQDLMDYLSQNEDFSYIASGSFLTSVNGREADASSNEFWAIYTDLKIGDLPYYDSTWGTIEVNGVNYASASKGITELPLNKDTVYVLSLSSW